MLLRGTATAGKPTAKSMIYVRSLSSGVVVLLVQPDTSNNLSVFVPPYVPSTKGRGMRRILYEQNTQLDVDGSRRS